MQLAIPVGKMNQIKSLLRETGRWDRTQEKKRGNKKGRKKEEDGTKDNDWEKKRERENEVREWKTHKRTKIGKREKEIGLGRWNTGKKRIVEKKKRNREREKGKVEEKKRMNRVGKMEHRQEKNRGEKEEKQRERERKGKWKKKREWKKSNKSETERKKSVFSFEAQEAGESLFLPSTSLHSSWQDSTHPRMNLPTPGVSNVFLTTCSKQKSYSHAHKLILPRLHVTAARHTGGIMFSMISLLWMGWVSYKTFAQIKLCVLRC